jgi:hypothetical protein
MLNGRIVATLTLQGVSDGAAGLAFVEASAATVEGENAVVVSHVGPNNFYSFRTFLPVLNK